MNINMDVIRLIMDASWPVQIVMLLLLAASFISWRIIWFKRKLIHKTKAASDDFETSFWSGGDLNTLYRSATR
ncbi:MAG: protein TolQ, partial [Pseudomonadota bacterium]|nr:protein TolQ [Pseudomonadota bacterium]